MGDQCRAHRGEIRCQRDERHEGHHRAETGHWDGKDMQIHDWAQEVKR